MPVEFLLEIEKVTKEITKMNDTNIAVGLKSISLVSKLFGLQEDVLKSNSKKQTVSDAKYIATWIMLRMAGLTLHEINSMFARDPNVKLKTIQTRFNSAVDMSNSYPGFKSTLITAGRAVLREVPHERIVDQQYQIQKGEDEIMNAIYQHQSPESVRTQPSPA